MLAKDLKTLVEEYEKGLIRGALEAAGGNQRRAAASLRILPTTLSEKMKRLGLRGQPPADESALGPGSAPERAG